MIFVKPTGLETALRKLGAKSIVGALLSSKAWSRVALALRDRAFFSARVESARFLSNAQGFLNDYLAQERETLPDGTVALKADGRARFIAQAQRFAIQEGIGPLGPVADKSLTDIRSHSRLSLIFDTQTRQAYGFGHYKAGLDRDILEAFPAQRFYRHPGATDPRPLHVEYQGAVRLKSDLRFWLYMNNREIGGFEVPWGPWGYRSYMDVEDVTRDEAEALKLLGPNDPAPQVPDVDFNDALQASVTDLSPEARTLLAQQFGRQVEFRAGVAQWVPVPPEAVP